MAELGNVLAVWQACAFYMSQLYPGLRTDGTWWQLRQVRALYELPSVSYPCENGSKPSDNSSRGAWCGEAKTMGSDQPDGLTVLLEEIHAGGR